jgi:hypothetical protein
MQRDAAGIQAAVIHYEKYIYIIIVLILSTVIVLAVIVYFIKKAALEFKT